MTKFESQKTQEELVDQIKKGSKKAKQELIEFNKGLIISEVDKFVKLECDRDDFIQEARIALLRAANTYDVEKNKSFFNYARVCVKNALLDIIEKEKKVEDIIEQAKISKKEKMTTESDFDEELFSKEEKKNINIILEKHLSERERLCLTLFAQDYSYAEIAKILDLEIKQVDNAISKARRKLRNTEEIIEIRKRLS